MEIKLIKIDNESYFVYQSSRKVYKERVADIMYFARGGRRVTMHSRESGEIELYCSLVEIYRVLITEGFHYINQSVLINISYITNIRILQKWEMANILKSAETEEHLLLINSVKL